MLTDISGFFRFFSEALRFSEDGPAAIDAFLTEITPLLILTDAFMRSNFFCTSADVRLAFATVSLPHIPFKSARRFALPFAALVFCTIGIPLALLSQRAVRYTGFSLSIAVVLMYYIFMQAGASLVQAEYLPPLIGAWLSNLLLGTMGLYLLWKKAEEKPIIFSASVVQAIQRLQDLVKK